MERDFIRELGYRALDNRLKRISDRLSHDTRKFFKQIELDVEPSWHLVFRLLKESKSLTMVEIAEHLGYTHPSTVVMLQKLTTKGYIISEKDVVDKRKLNIKLTQKSYEIYPELERIWDSCENALYKMLGKDIAIIKHIDNIESALKEIPINKRFQNEYQSSIGKS